MKNIICLKKTAEQESKLIEMIMGINTSKIIVEPIEHKNSIIVRHFDSQGRISVHEMTIEGILINTYRR